MSLEREEMFTMAPLPAVSTIFGTTSRESTKAARHVEAEEDSTHEAGIRPSPLQPFARGAYQPAALP
jgi:hypothetical protein